MDGIVCSRITIAPEWRGQMTANEVATLPEPFRLWFAGRIADRIGLISFVGPDKADALWREQKEQLQRALAASEASANDALSACARELSALGCPFWIIDGQRVRFVPVIANPENTPRLTLHEQPLKDVAYVQVAIHPSFRWGIATDRIVGREISQRLRRSEARR